jgi:hypothetical protein
MAAHQLACLGGATRYNAQVGLYQYKFFFWLKVNPESAKRKEPQRRQRSGPQVPPESRRPAKPFQTFKIWFSKCITGGRTYSEST